MGVGLDVGTNSLCVGRLDETGELSFKLERDCFYKIYTKTEVNRQAIKKSLEKRGSSFIEDGPHFIVVGEDALQIAMERNGVSSRPMQKGIISPSDKNNLPILKLLLTGILGKTEKDEYLVYSVPASPIDGSNFDIIYHTEILNMFFKDLGYTSQPINEAFAIALSELIDDGLTGICFSFGAGMVNVAVIHQGDPLVEFSTTRSGDYIDEAVGTALDMSPSLVQLDKEAGIDLSKPDNKLTEAVAVYYSAVLNYTIQNMQYELKRREKELPIFTEAVPLIISGGLAMAEGFEELFKTKLEGVDLPMVIGEVRRAESPMQCVANGCYLASELWGK